MVRQTMPPKRTTRASSSAVSSSQPQPVSASQPEPQQRQTRASAARKRRHSDGSNASTVESRKPNKKSNIATNLSTPAKRGRPKKSTPAAEDVIEEDDAEDVADEVIVASAKATPVCDGADDLEDDVQDESEEEESIQLSQQTSTKHVHFGAQGDSNTSLIEKSTATFITPHPRTKMSIKRRRTASPSEEGSVKRIKNTRTSLPHSLSQEEPTQIIQEHRFSPLKTILSERIKRLSMLRNQVNVDDEDVEPSSDNMLVLDGTDEFSIGQLPLTPQSQSTNTYRPLTWQARVGDAITQGAHDRAAWNADRKKYQDAITALKREADDARTQIEVLNMELETIGFGKNDASSLDVLQSIRESFARVREFLETELPGSLPEDASNEDLAEILVANVKEFADRLRTADREMHEKGQLVNDLGGQVNGLIDRLAKREIDKAGLLEQTTQLSGSNAEKDRDIDELEANLRVARQEKDDLEKALDDEKAHVEEVETENSDFGKDVARLSESLQRYQDEEAKLTSRINNMEKEHRATVTAMNKEREETVRDLEHRLDKETVEHGQVAALAQERQGAIEQLEARIEEVTTERDTFREKLEAMTEERDREQTTREQLETSLDQKDDVIDDLEHRVRALENDLDDYTEQLKTLRQLSENERAQREAAEKELDTRSTSFNEIDEKLREKGKEANELRQKLFEVQNKNDETVKELQNAASERDLQYQEDMATEIGRREKAEDLAKERANIVLDLEQQLEEVEGEMRELVVKKDSEIAVLEDNISQKDAEIQELNATLESDSEAHKAALEQNCRHIEGLENGAADLQQTIAGHESTIRDLEQAAIDAADEHKSHTEKRDAELAVLNDQLTELKVQLDNLEKERTRLERKVEHEAEGMLDMQNEKNAEIEELRERLRDKQAHILNVEAKKVEVEKQWEAVLAAREEQIRSLSATTERQTKTIDHLTIKFADYVRCSSGFIMRLQEHVDATKMEIDEEGSALQREGEVLLGEMFPAVPMGGEVGRQKVKGKCKKRREVDSGYGMSFGAVASD